MRAVKIASAYDKVYNDECVLSFDTPFSPDGLYVSLSSFQGYGQRHVALDHEKTGTVLYVHLKWTKVLKETPPEEKEAPTRMAIGVEGGFNVNEEKFDVVKANALVIMPEGTRVALPCPALPEFVINAATALINKTSANAEQKEAHHGRSAGLAPAHAASHSGGPPACLEPAPGPERRTLAAWRPRRGCGAAVVPARRRFHLRDSRRPPSDGSTRLSRASTPRAWSSCRRTRRSRPTRPRGSARRAACARTCGSTCQTAT